MKIPASKVPAQVWANKVKRNGQWEEDGLDGELYERWERSKQVYRVDSGIWETAIVDDDTELPVSALSLLPFDCLFLQHKSIFTTVDDFCFGGQEYRTEVATRSVGYFIVKGDSGDYFSANELAIIPLLDGVIAETKRLLDSHTVYEGTTVSSLSLPWHISLESRRVIGEVLSEFREFMSNKVNMSCKSESGAFIRDEDEESVSDDAVMLSVNRATEKLIGEIVEQQVGNVLGSLPYIISKGADVKTVYVPEKNRPRKSKQTDCTVHEVGYTVSRHLEKVRRIYMREGADVKPVEGGGEEKAHRHVSPHVRRAHWHGYWLGKRDNPTDLVIKWIAPVIVNGGNGELLGRVHVGNGD